MIGWWKTIDSDHYSPSAVTVLWRQFRHRPIWFFIILEPIFTVSFNCFDLQAIYGCDHKRDDEVDDCPNIYRGSIKTCKMGLNLRSAMFKTARCMFVEFSVKHLVLADALMDTFPESEVILFTIFVHGIFGRNFGHTAKLHRQFHVWSNEH